ncbi:hypothetical protein CSUI_003387 [Cystoisospora suis]|uniref:Transmembrane protein n=1 Tax=Cystoisospora suis TaxID=483139 RepID=A0A2C6KFG6_9APIC|nr:hypothetical protein CSUI_003387 [Cystoisospora suis]
MHVLQILSLSQRISLTLHKSHEFTCKATIPKRKMSPSRPVPRVSFLFEIYSRFRLYRVSVQALIASIQRYVFPFFCILRWLSKKLIDPLPLCRYSQSLSCFIFSVTLPLLFQIVYLYVSRPFYTLSLFLSFILLQVLIHSNRFSLCPSSRTRTGRRYHRETNRSLRRIFIRC